MRYIFAMVCILLISGCNTGISRDDIKEAIEVGVDAAFSEYDRITSQPTMSEIGWTGGGVDSFLTNDWGYWAQYDQGRMLFVATLDFDSFGLDNVHPPCRKDIQDCIDELGVSKDVNLIGFTTGSNPVTGSAVWAGKARAVQVVHGSLLTATLLIMEDLGWKLIS